LAFGDNERDREGAEGIAGTGGGGHLQPPQLPTALPWTRRERGVYTCSTGGIEVAIEQETAAGGGTTRRRICACVSSDDDEVSARPESNRVWTTRERERT
jgi:hypothetical protein